MSLKGKKITVHDMTLRDGMHPKRHQMSLEQMKSVACGLDAAGIEASVRKRLEALRGTVHTLKAVG